MKIVAFRYSAPRKPEIVYKSNETHCNNSNDIFTMYSCLHMSYMLQLNPTACNIFSRGRSGPREPAGVSSDNQSTHWKKCFPKLHQLWVLLWFGRQRAAIGRHRSVRATILQTSHLCDTRVAQWLKE